MVREMKFHPLPGPFPTLPYAGVWQYIELESEEMFVPRENYTLGFFAYEEVGMAAVDNTSSLARIDYT